LKSYDVDELIAGQRFGGFHVKLLLWSFVALVTDGYEITALPFAVPYLAAEWHLTGTVIGQLIAAGLLGILVGAALLGYLGDRFGRRAAIILSILFYGVGALAISWCTRPEPVYILRFLTGLGIGGALPNIVALNIESSPSRHAARIATLVGLGMILGSLLPGVAAATLAPYFGSQIVFQIGGGIAFLATLALFFTLTESLKFLVASGRDNARAVSLAREMRPDLDIADDAVFTSADEGQQGRVNLGRLFQDGLAPFTLLVWLAFSMGLLVNYAMTSWMPMLFERVGATGPQASVVSSMFHVGGVLGTLVMSALVVRYGFFAICAVAALGFPAIALLGQPGLGLWTLGLLVTLAGFCVLGIQAANNSMAGLIYPTQVRSAGLGFALSVGRIGSLVGPLIGGMLIDLGWSAGSLFFACAVPMAILSSAALALAMLSRRRFGLNISPAG